MGLNEEPPKTDDKTIEVEENESEEEVEEDEEVEDFDEDGNTILGHVTFCLEMKIFYFFSISSFRCAIRSIKFRFGCIRRTK